MGRLIAIPDIHGRLDLLEKILHNLFKIYALDLSKDKLIFLGDMIDRGPDSKGVLDKVRELQAKHPDNVVVLMGNHEKMCIDAHTYGIWDMKYGWLINGGQQCLESFKSNALPDDYIRWMASLAYVHKERGFFFSHAPAPADYRRSTDLHGKDFTRHELIWTYLDDDKNAIHHTDGSVGVCGHIHRLKQGILEPRFYDHAIFADCGSGCHDDAGLVAIFVETREFVQVWPDHIEDQMV